METNLPKHENRQRRNIQSTELLHKLTGAVNQLRYMKDHCEHLASGSVLEELIRRSYDAAPIRDRKGGYLSEPGPRKDTLDESEEERRLEQAICRQWHASRDGSWLLEGECRCVAKHQVPLYNKNGDYTKCGVHVDLLGVSTEFTPVVIELKRGGSKETPLRMLIEALGYAVVIRKAWNEGGLRREWMSLLGTQILPPEKIDVVPLIGMASSAYWSRCVGASGRHTAGQVSKEAWESFHRVVAKCKELGFPSTFVEFDVHSQGNDSMTESPAGLPMIHSMRIVKLPS